MFGIEFIDGFEVEQCFEGCDDGDSDPGEIDGWVEESVEVWKGEERCEAFSGLDDGNLDEVRSADGKVAPEVFEPFLCSDSEQHDKQRGWDG